VPNRLLTSTITAPQACFVLCAICDGHPKGQALCAASNLLAVLLKWLRSLFPPQVRTR
jgi:hypothetical protein